MADEPAAKRARLEPASMPHIPMELIVGPVACALLRARDKTLLALVQTSRQCAADIPVAIMDTVLTMRRRYWSPGLGERVFRCALRAGRSADDMDHILAVFYCTTPKLGWVMATPSAETLIRRLRPLRLTWPHMFQDDFSAFDPPAVIKAFCDTQFDCKWTKEMLAALIEKNGLPASHRPLIQELLHGRRMVPVKIARESFFRFMDTASEEEFDWMVEHCPLTTDWSLSDIRSKQVPKRLWEVMERYPYVARLAFRYHGTRFDELRPFDTIHAAWRWLLLHDHPHIASYLTRFSCSSRAEALALRIIDITIPPSALIAQHIPPDEVLDVTALSVEDRLMSSYVRLQRNASYQTPTPELLSVLYYEMKEYMT